MTQLFTKTYLEEFKAVIIGLNRPELHNAFNDELIAGLTNEFNELESDDSVHTVVLTGNGKSFCAGADLNWMKKMISYTFEENVVDSMNLANLFEVINNFSKPVVGKVSGAALGGGSGLVAVCDHVVATDNALFGFTEARLGLVPAVISPYVLDKIGVSQARSLFLSGERFDAKKALSIGLIHEVCSADQIDEKLINILKSYQGVSLASQVESKKLIFKVESLEDSSLKRKEYTCQTIAKMRVSADGQEGMNALLEKRKPVFERSK